MSVKPNVLRTSSLRQLTCDANENDGDEMELFAVVWAASQASPRFDLGMSVNVSQEMPRGRLTINCMATVVIRQQNMMIPIVSMRVRPTGYL